VRVVLVIVAAVIAIGFADTTYVVIGDPVGWNAVPFGGEHWNEMRCQLLYLQPELSLAGRVVSFSLFSDYSGSGHFYNAKVKLCNTTVGALSATFEDNYGGNIPAVVLSAPSLAVPPNPDDSWSRFDCAVPFYYDNNSNLLAEITWRGSDVSDVPMSTSMIGAGLRRVWTDDDSGVTGDPENMCMYARFGFFPYRLNGRLLTPNGGELWAGGDTESISWSVSPRNFFYGKVLLSVDGGLTYPTVLAPSVPPSETVRAVLLPQVNSDRCRVKFQAIDSSSQIAFQTVSDSCFTIDSEEPSAPTLCFPARGGYVNNPSIVFQWHRASDNMSGIAYYTVQIAYDSLFDARVDTIRRADTTYARALPSDTTYYWRVRATDRCGNLGPWSQVWKFEVDVQTPGVPTPLAPVGGVWFRNSTIGFQWTPVTLGIGLSPVRYILQLDTTVLFSHPHTDTLPAPFDTVRFLAESRYWWRVRAYDLAGNQGTFSNAEAFGIDMSPPAIPSAIYPPNLSAIWTDTTSIIWHVSGDNLSGTELYHLQLARDSAFADTVTGFAPTAGDTHRYASIPDTIEYCWRVRARDSAGNWSNWCQTRIFTRMVASVRAEHGSSPGAFDVTCNPSLFARETEFRIRLPERASVLAEIYNSAGRRVNVVWASTMPAGTNCIRWQGTMAQGDRAKPGFYLLRVTALGVTQTRALILVGN
jgi:hypothetical protein